MTSPLVNLPQQVDSDSEILGKFASSDKRAEAFKALGEKAKYTEITWNEFVITDASDLNEARRLREQSRPDRLNN